MPTVGIQSRVLFRTLAFFLSPVSLWFSSVQCFLRSAGRNCSWFLCGHRNPACLDLESGQELRGWRTLSVPISVLTLGLQGLPQKLLRQVREHSEALEFCVMALDVWCRSFPSRPFFFGAPEDTGGQLHKSLRFGSLQNLWRSSNVLVKQFEAAHSRASSGPRIIHVRSPSSGISIISAQAWFEAGHRCN